MPKVAFVGRNKLGQMFRILGMDFILVRKEGLKEIPQDYLVIFTEEAFYHQLKELYPNRLIVPLVDFDNKVNSLIVGMRESIESTVGEEVLKNE